MICNPQENETYRIVKPLVLTERYSEARRAWVTATATPGDKVTFLKVLKAPAGSDFENGVRVRLGAREYMTREDNFHSAIKELR